MLPDIKRKIIEGGIMKSIITSFLLVLSFQLLAHTTQTLTKGTLNSVDALMKVSVPMAKAMDKRYENVGGGTVFNAYKITKVNPLKKHNETDIDFSKRLIKSILHRDYPITGDDGGYSFSNIKFNNESEAESYIRKSIYWLNDSEEAAPFMKNFVKNLVNVTKESGVVVLEGEGSGNNTIAYIFAVIDLKNNEIFYIVDSNFGSDS